MGAGAGAMANARDHNNDPSIENASRVEGDLAAIRTFEVSLHHWKKNRVTLPDKFLLRLSFESLDLVNSTNNIPIVQFPFQNILSWGSSNKVFQFTIFDVDNCVHGKAPETIHIYISTSEGKTIEKWIMENVRKLMRDMEEPHAVTKDEFKSLKNLLFQVDETDENAQTSISTEAVNTPQAAPDDFEAPANGQLRDDWLQTIDQFSINGRKFLAKQGMELMVLIAPLQPFEKFDLALLLYDRIINPDSFQLIINTFDDVAERENVIFRLGLEKKSKDAKSGKFTPSCKIMQEYVPTPGSAGVVVSHKNLRNDNADSAAGDVERAVSRALDSELEGAETQ